MIFKILPIDNYWPKKLNDLGNRTPKELYFDGKWDDKLWAKTACVVGSRRMSTYGERVIEMLIPRLVEEGKTIISGMMYGVDQKVHAETIKCGGKTVAALGFGIRYSGIMNDDLRFLSKIIEAEGLVISEWENQPGALWTFPYRDRIMAALADEIFIVEAAVKSGSLITAEWGQKLKRKLLAVPGPVTSKISEGTNWLISTGIAQMWLPNRQLRLDETQRFKDGKDAEIYSILQNDTHTVDELARKLGRPVEEVGAKLSILVLEGKVEERGGKYGVAI